MKRRGNILRNIMYVIGLMVNKFTLLIYVFVGIFNVILVEFDTDLDFVFSLLLITLFLLDRCHKFYLREYLRGSRF